MTSFFQGILNVMNPSNSGGGSSGGNAAPNPGSASAATAAAALSAEPQPDQLSSNPPLFDEPSALPDQCQQAEDYVEPLLAAFKRLSKNADKCANHKQPEETELQKAFQKSAAEMKSKSNLFDCVLDGLASSEQVLIDRWAEMNKATTKWASGLRDQEHRLAELLQERTRLMRLAADLAKLRRRLGHAVQKQVAAGGGGGSSGTDTVGELQLEVSTKENEERKERDAYIVRLNSLQGEKPAHCEQLLQLMQARLNYHNACASHLQEQLPRLKAEVDRITQLSGPCYGFPLDKHLSRTGRKIAYVIDVCTAALKRDDVMDEEGLFRVNGPTSSVHKLESFLDVMQAESEIARYDSASVCGALKKYLKQLPEPLIGQALLSEWQKACGFGSSDERRMALHSCCCELQRQMPQFFDNLRHLIKFLALVSERQDRNKMSPKNLGICIGPNIVGGGPSATAASASGTVSSVANGGPNYADLHSANLGTLIVENLIVHHVFCFGSEDPSQAPPPPAASARGHHPLRRDSERSLGAASFASSSTAEREPGTPTNSASNNNNGGDSSTLKFSTKSFHSDLYDTAFTLHALRSNGVAAAADAALATTTAPNPAVDLKHQATRQDRPAASRTLSSMVAANAAAAAAAAAAPSSSSASTAAAPHEFVKQARSIFEGHLLKSASLGTGAGDSPRLTRFKDLRSLPSAASSELGSSSLRFRPVGSASTATTAAEAKFMNLPSNLSIPPVQSPTLDALPALSQSLRLKSSIPAGLDSLDSPVVGATADLGEHKHRPRWAASLLRGSGSFKRRLSTRSHHGHHQSGGTAAQQQLQPPQTSKQPLPPSPARPRKPPAPMPPQAPSQPPLVGHSREASLGGSGSGGDLSATLTRQSSRQQPPAPPPPPLRKGGGGGGGGSQAEVTNL